MKNTLRKVLALTFAVMMIVSLVGCKSSQSSKIVALEEIFATEEYGIGFRSTDIAFGLKVQEAFDALVADGTAAEISNTWFGEDTILKDAAFLEETEAAADDDSWTKIQQRGYFILGLDASFPPMGFLNDQNEIVGFDIDLAKAVAAKLGIEVKLQPIDWSSKEMELDNGNIDCIWNGMTINQGRLDTMYFTKPYLANEQIILTGDNSKITGKATLSGKVVAAQSGSSGLEAVEADTATKDTFKELVTYDDYVSAYQDLKVGRIDALVIDSVVGYYLIAQDNG